MVSVAISLASGQERKMTQFRVTIEMEGEIIYQAVHEADGTEPALRDAMRAARKANPGRRVYLSQVTLEPLEESRAP